jgi:hypothetical protein
MGANPGLIVFKLSPCSVFICFLLGNSQASEFYMPEFYMVQVIFEPKLFRINTPTFSTTVIIHTYLPMKMEHSVPKRRHIKFRRHGITQKKAYNIQNMAKV